MQVAIGEGVVVVSWDAVAGANGGYTIRYIDLYAANDAYAAGERWQHLYRTVDVDGATTTTHTLPISDFTPGAQYGFEVGSRSSSSANPNWSTVQRLRFPAADADPMVAADISPVHVLGAALATTRHANELVNADLPTSQDGLRQFAATVARHKTALTAQLEILSGSGQSIRVHRIQTLVNDLVSNAEAIQRGRGPLLRALQLENSSRVRLVEDNRDTLFPAADAAADEQFYQLATRASDGSAGTAGITKDDILRYTHTGSLASNVTLGHTLLLVASLMQDPTFVGRIEETYDSVAGRTDRDIEYLEENPVDGLDSEILDLAKNVRDAGGQDEEHNYFERLQRRLQLTVAENDLISANQAILRGLTAEIDNLAAVVQGRQAPALAVTPEETAGTPGVNANSIIFGQSAALTGPNAGLGMGMRSGIEVAFNEANGEGGVNGRILRLTVHDDGYEPDRAFANTLRMIESGRVFALIGAVGTPTARAASPVAHGARVPFVAPFTGAQLLRDQELTNVLNLRASYHQETEKMVDYLASRNKNRVAVLYQNDSYGIDGLNGVKTAVDSREQMELVEYWYYRRNTSAVKSAVFRIADADPDAVIFVGTHAPTAQAIEMLRDRLDPDPAFMSVSFVGSNALAESLGEDGEGVHVTQVVPLPDDESIDIVADYLAALAAYGGGAEPGFISLEGYLAGRMTIAGLQACGADVTRECFLDAVHGLEDLNGFDLMFGPGDNQGSDAVFLTIIGPDGEYDAVD